MGRKTESEERKERRWHSEYSLVTWKRRTGCGSQALTYMNKTGQCAGHVLKVQKFPGAHGQSTFKSKTEAWYLERVRLGCVSMYAMCTHITVQVATQKNERQGGPSRAAPGRGHTRHPDGPEIHQH